MRDAEVERPPDDRPLDIERPVIPEVLPQAERHLRQLDAAAAAAAVLETLIAIDGGNVTHAPSLSSGGWHY
jgi:hypothetical protein